MLDSTVVLIRGVSGVGKSTFARTFFPTLPLFEADQFFVDPATGEYSFDPTKLADAHGQCQDQVRASIQAEQSCVVANTFTQYWEMKPYFDMLVNKHFSIVVVELVCDCKEYYGDEDQLEIYADWLAERNEHGCSSEVIKRQLARFKTFTDLMDFDKRMQDDSRNWNFNYSVWKIREFLRLHFDYEHSKDSEKLNYSEKILVDNLTFLRKEMMTFHKILVSDLRGGGSICQRYRESLQARYDSFALVASTIRDQIAITGSDQLKKASRDAWQQ